MSDPEYGLPAATWDRIRTVFANHPEVESVVLYGSRAMGTHKPNSDIDLTLHGTDLGIDLLGILVEELDDLLLPWMIDLSIFAKLNHSDLEDHIRRVGKVVYRRD
jgi:predicted nucleotidyltransferase